jgi:hypothetical protein
MKKLQNTSKKSSLPELSEAEVSTIENKLLEGTTLVEICEEKNSPIKLTQLYRLCRKNPELEKKILEARKYGVQTLIDKLMKVYDRTDVDNPNLILWTRERSKWVQWLASKLTDIYSDNKPTQVKTDQNITVRFESSFNEPIELDPAEYEFTPPNPIKKD